MAHGYKAVGWNRQKKVYDSVLAAAVLGYLGIFIGASFLFDPEATAETVLIRALGTAALLLLHVVLAIGPLARLDSRFLPLLYNRRHLGVTVFGLGLAHGVFALVQFHGLGNVSPWVSLLVSNGRYNSLAHFPFQILGALALVVLFLMAATSHDFWLAQLTPPWWKGLHMAVYVAYGLLVMHVALGVLQSERDPLLAAVLGLGLATTLTLHLLAATRGRAIDEEPPTTALDGFVAACRVGEIPEKRAKVVRLGAERVAIFRYDGKISAVSNVCRHQNGPLGEGRILPDGCITCPWHGFQYRPETGASPPPFEEKVETYRVRVEGDQVWVDPRPNAPGTYVEPARLPSGGEATA